MTSYWLDFRLCDAQLKSVAGYLHVANHLQHKNLKIVSFVCRKQGEKSGSVMFLVGLSSRGLRSFLPPALLKGSQLHLLTKKTNILLSLNS
jgi:hypothetical protein